MGDHILDVFQGREDLEPVGRRLGRWAGCPSGGGSGGDAGGCASPEPFLSTFRAPN